MTALIESPLVNARFFFGSCACILDICILRILSSMLSLLFRADDSAHSAGIIIKLARVNRSVACRRAVDEGCVPSARPLYDR